MDPTNTSSSWLYYTYTPGGSWELTGLFESQKHIAKAGQDGGPDPVMYEVGTDLDLSPFAHGLAGYWKFDESSGTLADSSGYGNGGTESGGVTYGASGKVGTALSFDGAGDYVEVSGSVATPADPFSVVLWAKTSSASRRTLIGIGDAFENQSWGLSTEWSDPPAYYSVRLYAWSQVLNTGIKLSDGIWHFIALTYNGESASLSVDDNAATTASVALVERGGDLYIGGKARSELGIHYWTGPIDDVRIYNRALSDAEIEAIYNAQN